MCVASGARARAEPRAADVRLPRHPEGAGVHPRRAAAGGGARAGRTRAQVRQGPERKPRGECNLVYLGRVSYRHLITFEI